MRGKGEGEAERERKVAVWQRLEGATGATGAAGAAALAGWGLRTMTAVLVDWQLGTPLEAQPHRVDEHLLLLGERRKRKRAARASPQRASRRGREARRGEGRRGERRRERATVRQRVWAEGSGASRHLGGLPLALAGAEGTAAVLDGILAPDAPARPGAGHQRRQVDAPHPRGHAELRVVVVHLYTTDVKKSLTHARSYKIRGDFILPGK